MKLKTSLILTSVFALLFFPLVALPVLAASSDFLPGAENFYSRYCGKKNLPSYFAMSCYLFEKVDELETEISTQSAKVNSLEERIEDIETLPTPTEANTVPVKGVRIRVFSEDPMHVIVETYGLFDRELPDVFWGTVLFNDVEVQGAFHGDRLVFDIPDGLFPEIGEVVKLNIYTFTGGTTTYAEFDHTFSTETQEYSSF